MRHLDGCRFAKDDRAKHFSKSIAAAEAAPPPRPAARSHAARRGFGILGL